MQIAKLNWFKVDINNDIRTTTNDVILVSLLLALNKIKTTTSTLTPFKPMVHFYTPLKRQETRGFLPFSGGKKNGTLAWNGLIWCFYF